ncbi:ATP-binding protein [Crossiella sp. SN42]|uniref:ATP-binding protein n=1 Tax=Crossiella sp. SN42 TaxID=2944808 RepID=UPI00207C9BE8|nr:zonular occludens toxin domain-containing protein [Crossiella sp. SN42]MCO1581213.1 ATP-binding protein [Crossiella sp. SN42]
MTNNEPPAAAPAAPEGTGEELARVHYLPTTATPEALEGEVLTDAQYRAYLSQKEQALARYRGYARDTARAYHGVLTLARRTGGSRGVRFVRRHGTFILKGMEAERQRRKAEHGQLDARGARRAALAAGDLAQVAELNQQIQQERQLRVQALQARAELGWYLGKRGALACGCVLATALTLGLANDVSSIFDVELFGDFGTMDVLSTTGAIATGSYALAAWCVLNVWVFALAGAGVWGFRRWKDGVRLGEAILPESLRTTLGTSMQYIELTESSLAIALANIRNDKLAAAIKDGWPNRDTDNAWVLLPIKEGKGYTVKLRLPHGVPVTAVAKAKEYLAHNLGCRMQELFIVADEHDPTVMVLHRLDPGVLREPVPPYPLLEEGSTDYFKGFPVGITPRGDLVTGVTSERNYVIAGEMGSGKTTLILALLAGAILDPLVDIDVFVFATNNDYDWLKPCLNTFSDGDSKEKVQACLDHIQALHADLELRGQLLKKYDEDYVTRELAAKDARLRPRIVVIDECQSYFRQPTPKKRREVVDGMVRFFSAARKYGITVIFATPVPSDQSLPRDLVSVTSNTACFAISDKTRNNVVLGDKAHENGISALGLKPKTETELNDAGTSITRGFLPTPGALRSYFLTKDQRTQLVKRALELRGGQAAGAQPAAAERDWLADLAQVCHGHEKVRLTDAAGWLRKLAPSYRAYKSLDGKTLAEWLDGVGVPVTWPSRQPTAVTERIQAAVSERQSIPAGE